MSRRSCKISRCALALLGVYERVLHSGKLLEYHLTAPFPESLGCGAYRC
jgi:hypothetical protein